jgi:hypothetical protein
MNEHVNISLWSPGDGDDRRLIPGINNQFSAAWDFIIQDAVPSWELTAETVRSILILLRSPATGVR